MQIAIEFVGESSVRPVRGASPDAGIKRFSAVSRQAGLSWCAAMVDDRVCCWTSGARCRGEHGDMEGGQVFESVPGGNFYIASRRTDPSRFNPVQDDMFPVLFSASAETFPLATVLFRSAGLAPRRHALVDLHTRSWRPK